MAAKNKTTHPGDKTDLEMKTESDVCDFTLRVFGEDADGDNGTTGTAETENHAA